MDAPIPAISAHPAGEVKTAHHYPAGTWPLDTPGGRFYAEWDDKSPVTREGQLIFFFQFLQAGGRWAAFLRDCSLYYKGNRGSGAINVNYSFPSATIKMTPIARGALDGLFVVRG